MSILPRIVLLALLMMLLAPLLSDAAGGAAGAAAGAASLAQPAAQVLAQAPAESPLPTPPPTPTPSAEPMEEMATPFTIGIGLFLLALALVGGTVAGVWRRGSIRGPQRLPPAAPVLPILAVLLIGGVCWFGGQILIFGLLSHQHGAAHGGERLTPEKLTASHLALLATVPGVLALLIMLAGDSMFTLLRPIGLRLPRLPRMLLVGFGGGIVALLLVYGCSSLLQVFYQWVDYQHPSEHELLTAMKQASPTAQIVLLVGACVIAPLFEELLFRGHMQTLLTRLFVGAVAPAPAPAPPWALVERAGAAPSAHPLPMPALESAPATPTGYAASPVAAEAVTPLPMPALGHAPAPVVGDSIPGRWLAVIITSLVFSLVHPLWTAPLIFLLSLAIGYAYERSGSLWVPIVMHAMFNTSSTLVFFIFA